MAKIFAALAFFLCSVLQAQEFPARTVRIVVPFTPEGPVDTLGRVIAARLAGRWKAGVVVENRSGAGTVLGTDYVAKSAPDGYTILLAVTSHAVNATLVDNLPFDPVKDFAPVVLAATAQNILAVNLSVPARSPAELIALAKAKPSRLSAGSPGQGTTPHLAAEMLKSMAGIDFAIIHYKGSQPAVHALLSGEVDFMFDAGTVLAQAGKLRVLATAGTKRSPFLHNTPTMIESGLPRFEVVSWYGFLAPAGTPRAVIDTLNRAINDALHESDVRTRIGRVNLEPAGGTPEDFDRYIKNQIAVWGSVIRTAGVRVD
jgi:tripartite-type tricarboxylate transporter receptor subunit TctC